MLWQKYPESSSYSFHVLTRGSKKLKIGCRSDFFYVRNPELDKKLKNGCIVAAFCNTMSTKTWKVHWQTKAAWNGLQKHFWRVVNCLRKGFNNSCSIMCIVVYQNAKYIFIAFYQLHAVIQFEKLKIELNNYHCNGNFWTHLLQSIVLSEMNFWGSHFIASQKNVYESIWSSTPNSQLIHYFRPFLA